MLKLSHMGLKDGIEWFYSGCLSNPCHAKFMPHSFYLHLNCVLSFGIKASAK